MPANIVALENMRKHLTPAERAARAAAEQALTRTKVRLVAPKYIKDDPAALTYWRSIVRRMETITLLDDLDAEMLAAYCQILSRRDALSKSWREGTDAAKGCEDPALQLALIGRLDDTLKRLEAQERLAIQYAERLGLTPSGRVRLAKKRAEEKQLDPDDDLYGDGG